MTGPDIIMCEPYECSISETSCALRHRTAVTGNIEARTRMSHCVECEVGIAKAVRAKLPVLVSPSALVKPGSNWNPQIKGGSGYNKWAQGGK